MMTSLRTSGVETNSASTWKCHDFARHQVDDEATADRPRPGHSSQDFSGGRTE
jgi:hypothetical protein